MQLAAVTSAVVGARLDPALDAVVALGALEQHGPHLPLGTDTMIAGAIATRVADAVGDLAVLPALPIGCSGHHLGFAGTVSVDEETLAAVIGSTVTSLLDHGFRHAYVVTGHAGNCGAMRRAHRSLAPALAERTAVFADWPAQRDAVHQVSRQLGLDPDVVGTHGGHFETSIVLALAPEQVDGAAARPGFVGAPAEAGARLQAEGMAAVSPIGVIGDPAGATAEAGAAYLAALVDHVVDGVRRHRAERAVVAR